MEYVKLALVVVHVTAATLLFGAPLGVVRLSRAALVAGDAAFKLAAAEAGRRAKLALIGSMMTLMTGLSLIFVGGGFAAVSKNYHAALGLMLLALAFSFLWMKPSTQRLVAAANANPIDQTAANAALRKLGMGSGILHGLWLVLLVLMFLRF